jgi:hypothetical protein
MDKSNFWPLDFHPEGEVYENVAWDLPGYTHRHDKRDRARKVSARVDRERKELR